MNFLRKSPSEWLSADVIAAQPEPEQRLIGQILGANPAPTLREMKAGTNVFKQGFAAQAVHLVLDGEVAVAVNDAEMARLGPGSVFGEMAMLGNRTRTGTLTTTMPTTICSLGESSVDRDDLRALAVLRGLEAPED